MAAMSSFFNVLKYCFIVDLDDFIHLSNSFLTRELGNHTTYLHPCCCFLALTFSSYNKFYSERLQYVIF